MKIMGNIKKLYETIKIKWVGLPETVKILFNLFLIFIISYGTFICFSRGKILGVTIIFLGFIVTFILSLSIYKKLGKLSLVLPILFFILFILELTPYGSQCIRKPFEERTSEDFRNCSIHILCSMSITILACIFNGISFLIGKPGFLCTSINRSQNIIIGIFSIIIGLFMILGTSSIIITNLKDDDILLLDSVPPYYNEVILSTWGNRGNGILLLRDNYLEKIKYDNIFSTIMFPMLKWCITFSLSPNTHYIAYCDGYSSADIENIWLIKSNGKEKRQFTYNERVLISTCSSFPLFNSKSNKIAFLRYRLIKESRCPEEFLGLYVINIDGTGERQLFSGVIRPGDWSWAPNGREIYFIKNGNLWLVDVESGIQKQLTKDGRKYSSPIPAPDGTKLLIFIGKNSEVKPSIFDIHKLKITKIFSNIKIVRGRGGYPVYYYIKWSIKGDRILFSYFGRGHSNAKIGILNLLDWEITNLTSGETKDSWPIWYNKEEQIMFVRNDKEIWIINNDGSNTKKIF